MIRCFDTFLKLLPRWLLILNIFFKHIIEIDSLKPWIVQQITASKTKNKFLNNKKKQNYVEGKNPIEDVQLFEIPIICCGESLEPIESNSS